MYYAFFGLTQAPFKITPNTDFFFGGGNRGAILEALIYAITQGEGIIKVTGEVGSGKTMLCRMLQSRLPENVETVYLANPSVSPEEILHAIAFELQLPHRQGRRPPRSHARAQRLPARAPRPAAPGRGLRRGIAEHADRRRWRKSGCFPISRPATQAAADRAVRPARARREPAPAAHPPVARAHHPQLHA